MLFVKRKLKKKTRPTRCRRNRSGRHSFLPGGQPCLCLLTATHLTKCCLMHCRWLGRPSGLRPMPAGEQSRLLSDRVHSPCMKSCASYPNCICGPGHWHSPGMGYMQLPAILNCQHHQLSLPDCHWALLWDCLPAGPHLHKYNTWCTAWECWESETPSDAPWDLASLMLFSAREVTAAPAAITRLLVMASCGWLPFWTGHAVNSLHSTLTRPSWENDLTLVCYIFLFSFTFPAAVPQLKWKKKPSLWVPMFLSSHFDHAVKEVGVHSVIIQWSKERLWALLSLCIWSNGRHASLYASLIKQKSKCFLPW